MAKTYKETLDLMNDFVNGIVQINKMSDSDLQNIIVALEIVNDVPRVLQNLKNMKSAWEDESFKDRRYAEAHIKSLRTAIEQVEQLIR